MDSLDASFRYPQVRTRPDWNGADESPHHDVVVFLRQDYQFHIQNFTALQLGTEVPPGRQATFEYSFIPAEPMGGRPFGLVINLNYKDGNVSASSSSSP